MDGLINKLPFQGANCNKIHINPWRCLRAELTNDFQPLKTINYNKI